MGKGALRVSDNHWAVAPATTNSTRTQTCLPGVHCLRAPCWPSRLHEISICTYHPQALPFRDSPAPELQLSFREELAYALSIYSKEYTDHRQTESIQV